MDNLKIEAEKIYFEQVKNPEWQDKFTIELQKREVVDKRGRGYYCTLCNKFSNKGDSFVCENSVIFPNRNREEIWILHTHYDGCRGWD